MNSVPSNNHPSYYDAVRQSFSRVPHQQVDLENHGALTPYDVPFFDDFLGVGGGFAANPFPVFYPQAPPPGFQHITHSPVIGEPQRIGRSPHGPQRPRSYPDPFIHPAVAPQSPFDGTYSLQIHPSAWYPTASGPGSSAIYASGGGEQAALAGAPVPSRMTGTVPMAPFPSTLHVMVPTSRSPAGTRMPVDVRPWYAAPTGASCARAAGPPPPRPVPTPFCRCHLRAHPLVRVDDTIEWVRPDLMRMSVWFNWSVNADAEAHESWERRA
jgi:hypothetical protein